MEGIVPQSSHALLQPDRLSLPLAAAAATAVRSVRDDSRQTPPCVRMISLTVPADAAGYLRLQYVGLASRTDAARRPSACRMRAVQRHTARRRQTSKSSSLAGSTAERMDDSLREGMHSSMKRYTKLLR